MTHSKVCGDVSAALSTFMFRSKIWYLAHLPDSIKKNRTITTPESASCLNRCLDIRTGTHREIRIRPRIDTLSCLPTVDQFHDGRLPLMARHEISFVAREWNTMQKKKRGTGYYRCRCASPKKLEMKQAKKKTRASNFLTASTTLASNVNRKGW